MEKYFIRNRYINETVNVDHNSLTNRDATESHPASAISYDDGTATLTDVQTQLEKQKIELKETGEAINIAGLVTLNDSDGKIYTSFEYGDIAQFSSSTATISQIIDIDTDKALIFYRGNSINLSVRLATITGKTITYSEPVSISSSGFNIMKPVKIETNKVVIGFVAFTSGSHYPQVCVISVAGSTITVGTLYTLKNTNSTNTVIKLAYYNTNKVIAIYRDPNVSNNNYYNLLTISGDTITVGTATALTDLTNLSVYNLAYSNRTGYVIANYITDDKYHYFRIIYILGTNVYIGNEFTISSFASASYTKIFPIDQASFLVVMVDYGASYYTVAFVCKWSKYTTVDSKSSYCITNTNDSGGSDKTIVNLDNNKFLFIFGNYAQILNIDDAVVKVSIPKTGFQSTFTCEHPSICRLSNGKTMLVFRDSTDDFGYGVVLDINNSTGLALTPQFSSNLITDRTDNISVVPYLSLT